jgi:hypothetical protein
MDRSTDEAADPTARNEGSNWLMELFKHMYAGYMFGTQAEPGMANLGTEQYAPLPADQRQANAGLQRYVPGLSYTQGQVDALSRKYSLDYAPHDLVGAAGAGKSTTGRGLVLQQFSKTGLAREGRSCLTGAASSCATWEAGKNVAGSGALLQSVLHVVRTDSWVQVDADLRKGAIRVANLNGGMRGRKRLATRSGVLVVHESRPRSTLPVAALGHR